MRIFENCSIVSGAAISHDECLITVMNDALATQRVQHSVAIMHLRGSWSFLTDEPVLPWITAAVTKMSRPSRAVVIVGWAGQVLVVENGGSRREGILRKDRLPVSILRAAAAIGIGVYAAGMSRQVYKRTDRNAWIEIDHAVVNTMGEFGTGFNAIDGFSESEIYAAGTNGELWKYDARNWHKIDSPVNVHLHSLCCAADGYVYVGGREGLLLRGRHDYWEVVDIGIDAPIWDVHSFGEDLYLIANGEVHRYVHGATSPVELVLPKGDFLKLSSADSTLWAFGRKKIVRFDGSAWSERPGDIPDADMTQDVAGFFNNDVLEQGSRFLAEE
jgi:hypothetical protein